MVKDACAHSIIKRAADDRLIEIICVNIRDFSTNKHHQADDAPYGGGAGMVLTPGPVVAACEYAAALSKDWGPVIYLSPHGERYNQNLAKSLARYESIILLCGHYEGIDQRALDLVVTKEISVGDYILTGGELPALMVIDSVSRFIPGVLGKEQSSQEESFSDGLLEYPQYTRPPVFMDRPVPDILLSGHHQRIREWRKQQSILITSQKRPDLLAADRGNPKEESGASAKFMKGIITVLGKDQVGIIAKVCTYLSENGVNILDITQTIRHGYFNMLMIVDLSASQDRFEEISQNLIQLGENIGVQIKLQHEDIFNTMHRI
jgi:tRNA (guanine37-N1)-methyltransferase